MSLKIKWACPKCGAEANEHGKGGAEKCVNARGEAECCGFLCECAADGTDPDHGTTFAAPCPEANCHHCDWGGTFPVKPKGLATWERKALEAGWTPPAPRARELATARRAQTGAGK